MPRPKKIEKRITEKRDQLASRLKALDQNKRNTVDPLIARAAFVIVHLQDLEVQLNAEGWTEEYQNGQSQSGIKRSAAADVHIALTKNLTAITKQLLELVPAAKRQSKLEGMRSK